MLGAARELTWQTVPERAVILAEKCAGLVQDARAAIADLPTDGFLDLWYNESLDKLLLNVGDWIDSDVLADYKRALTPLAEAFDYDHELGRPGSGDGEGEGLWVKIAMRPLVARAFQEKRSASPTLDWMARGLGFKPGVIPTAPNPLVAGLTSGLLGAGLGYGAGWLGEQFMPETWQPGRLRNTLAVLGGLAGAAPAALWAGTNVYGGKPWNSGEAMAGSEHFDSLESHMPTHPDYTGYPSLHTLPELERYAGKQGQAAFIEDLEKAAFVSQTGFNGPWPAISVPDFHAAVNLDPRVRDRLDPATRAAATGVVHGASMLEGGPKLVSPLGVARMAAGMGSGYLSGLAVGKVLGMLTGAPPATQERLKNTGMWAGLVGSLLPMVFPG